MNDLSTAVPQVPMLHDCVVQRKKTAARARVMPVPPEEFGISRYARHISTTNYCFHRPLGEDATEAALIAKGYDPVQIKALPTATVAQAIAGTEEINRDTVAESQYTGDTANQSARQIDIIEHYCRCDYEGEGEAKLYKITTAGVSGEILRKTFQDDDGKERMREDIEEMDLMPFAALTPIIITHRFFGRSIADLVMEIQKIKTALIRGMLDGTYMRLNPRPEISEQHATAETVEQIQNLRIGQPYMVRAPGGVNWIETPDTASTTFPMLEYMDQVREMRTGVTKQGQGVDANALSNQSATAVNQVYTMAQGRMKLIARIFAETGIKDLFILLHATIRKHGQQAETVRLRNKWVPVDPRNWKTRDDLTVHVGLGTGSKPEQLQQTMALANFQKELLLGGKSNMVQDKNLFETCKRLTKLMGEKDVTRFFTDPSTVPPPAPPPPDPKLAIEQMKIQGDQQKTAQQAQLEQQKMQIDATHQAAKNTAEAALAEKKFQLEAELKLIDAQLKLEQADREHLYHQQEMAFKTAAAERDHAHKMAAENNKADNSANVNKLSEHMAKLTEQHNEGMKALRAALGQRKRTAIRDPKTNKIIAVQDEPMETAT